MRNITLFFLLAVCFITGTSFLWKTTLADGVKENSEPSSIADTFPVPPPSSKRIFYLQRTQNINTIVYDLNYNSDSTLNAKEPIHMYWIRYADKGEVKDLSYIQKNYAYGVNTVCIDKVKKNYKVTFVSYKKRSIYLMKAKTGNQYHAFLDINNKLTYLSRIFIKIDGGSFWLPHVTYVEVTGHDIVTGKTLIEKIIP